MSLWKLCDLIQLNKDYQIEKYLGCECLAFGTDGGRVCYGFDFSLEGSVFMSSLGDLDKNKKNFLAKNFDKFIEIDLSIIK